MFPRLSTYGVDMKKYYPASVGLLKVVILLALLLPLLSTIGCCKSTELSGEVDPTVVFVEEARITEGPTEGTYIVTDGWLTQRLQFEHALHLKLRQCEERHLIEHHEEDEESNLDTHLNRIYELTTKNGMAQDNCGE